MQSTKQSNAINFSPTYVVCQSISHLPPPQPPTVFHKTVGVTETMKMPRTHNNNNNKKKKNGSSI